MKGKKKTFLLIAALLRLYLDDLGFNLDLISLVPSSVKMAGVMFSQPADELWNS